MKENKIIAFLSILILFLGITALLMLPPLIMALVLGEKSMVRAFLFPLIPALTLSIPAFIAFKRSPLHMRARAGFLLVFLTWVLMSLMGAVPYAAGVNSISFTDSVFESTCAFATTGGTTIGDIEALPVSLLLWRSISHWAGGMGIVLLSVALVPLLGVGGFQLIKAEAPGPEKEKVTPKITATAKILWLVYFVLTVTVTLLYRAGGMEWFDSICHGMTTMASGGVSTKNAGLAYFNSPFIEAVTAVFMLLAALNFNLYCRILKGKIRDVFTNTEARFYFAIYFIAAAFITVSLTPFYGSFTRALRCASFQAASVLSTTGMAVADYETWPAFAQMTLFCLMFIGGCSGSTAGGLKVIRAVILWKQAGNELRRAVYPQGVFNVTLNQKVGRTDVVYGVSAFVFLYMGLIAVTTLVTAASGVDIFSSFSAALSIAGNTGIGFGAAGPSHNYAPFADHVKWLFSFVMIAGRLELWTVVILFTPEYWKR
jgi:trk system potassium uptake protein TrkH